MISISEYTRIEPRQIYLSDHLKISPITSLMQRPNTSAGRRHSTHCKRDAWYCLPDKSAIFGWSSRGLEWCFSEPCWLGIKLCKDCPCWNPCVCLQLLGRLSVPSSFLSAWYFCALFKCLLTLAGEWGHWEGKHNLYIYFFSSITAHILTTSLDFHVRNYGGEKNIYFLLLFTT